MTTPANLTATHVDDCAHPHCGKRINVGDHIAWGQHGLMHLGCWASEVAG